MPQFDKITFFNQIFWLILLFSTFYFIILKNFLPKISSVLKARTKKLIKGNSLTENSGLEIEEALSISNQEIAKCSFFFRNSLLRDFETSNTWLNSEQQNLAEMKKVKQLFVTHYGNVIVKKFSL